MRTLLHDGLDRYEVLKASEPLRRGERPVVFSGRRAALDFLSRTGGPGGATLRHLAREDFAGEFAPVPDDRLAAEFADRFLAGTLKVAQIATPSPRLRSTGAEYVVLSQGDRPRRGEALMRVWDETSAARYAHLLTAMPAGERARMGEVFPALRAGSQGEQSKAFSRLLVTGHIQVAQVSTLRVAGGTGAPPEGGGQEEAEGFGWRDAASLGVGLIPVVGDAVDIAGAIIGKDLITGEKLSVEERLATAAGTLLGSGKAARMGMKAVKQPIKAGGKRSLGRSQSSATSKSAKRLSGKTAGQAGSVYERRVREATGGNSQVIEGREIDSVTDKALIQAKDSDAAVHNPHNFLSKKVRTQIKKTIELARTQGKEAQFWFSQEPHAEVRHYIEQKGGKTVIFKGD